MRSSCNDITLNHCVLIGEHHPIDFDQYVSRAEQDFATTLRLPRQRAYLTGRYLTRKTITQTYQCPAEQISVRTLDSGKPYATAGNRDIAVSISHDEKIAACAISNTYQLGIDVEAKSRKPINKDSWSLAFTNSEQSVLNNLDSQKQDTLSLFWWCLKEAVFKISGQGTFTQLDCSSVQKISNDVVTIKGMPKSWQLKNVPEIPTHHLTLCIAP